MVNCSFGEININQGNKETCYNGVRITQRNKKI